MECLNPQCAWLECQFFGSLVPVRFHPHGSGKASALAGRAEASSFSSSRKRVRSEQASQLLGDFMGFHGFNRNAPAHFFGCNEINDGDINVY